MLLGTVLLWTSSGQTNENILVPKDSLWNVFINYEKSKETLHFLKMDTISLRLAISQLKSSNGDLKLSLLEYENKIIPMKDSIALNLEEEIVIHIKDKKKKYLKGFKDSSIVVFILTLSGYFIFK